MFYKCPIGCLPHWLPASLTARLTDCQTDWLTDWVTIVAYLAVGTGTETGLLGCHLLGTPLMHVAAILPSTQLDYAKYWKWLNRKLSKNSRQNRMAAGEGEGEGGGAADLNLGMRIWYRTGANLKGKLAAKMLNECQIECPLDMKLHPCKCVCVCVCVCVFVVAKCLL